MSDVMNASGDLAAFGIALALFGLLPGPVLRLLCLMFPKGSPRPEQLRGDFEALDYWKRPFFVASTVELALFEALPERRRVLARLIWTCRWPLSIAISIGITSVFSIWTFTPEGWIGPLISVMGVLILWKLILLVLLAKDYRECDKHLSKVIQAMIDIQGPLQATIEAVAHEASRINPDERTC